jgi:hypothetical protein
MAAGNTEGASWQSWLLGIAAVLIAGGLFGLTSTLIGLRSDIDVVMNDIQYMKKQSDRDTESHDRMIERLNDHELRLQRIESDNTRTRR